MDTVYTETLHGLKIEIFYDENPISPDEDENTDVFILADSRQFSTLGPSKLGFKRYHIEDYFHPVPVCPFCGADVSEKEEKYNCEYCEKSFDTPAQNTDEYFKDYFVFPLSAYIHGNIKLYLGTQKVCSWDSGIIGLVLVRKDISENLTEEKAEEYAQGIIEYWNDYLNGNVYGYCVENSNGETIDSVWGFFGDYKKNALVEAREYVECITEKGKTDHNGQILMKFSNT